MVRLNLEVFLKIDEVFHGLVHSAGVSKRTDRLKKDIISLFCIYRANNPNLKHLNSIFQVGKDSLMIKRARRVEEIILSLFVVLQLTEHWKEVDMGREMVLLHMNFILIVDLVIDQLASLHRGSSTFVKIKRLLSKRKTFYKLPSLFSEESSKIMIQKNLSELKESLNIS